MNNNHSTIIIETNSLDKESWAYIYSFIESIEQNKLDLIKFNNGLNYYFLENSLNKKRIRLPIGIKINNKNISLVNKQGSKDYLIIYNRNNPNRNLNDFIPFFNLIDIYKKRISLGININGINIPQKREDYHFTISQFLFLYKENKNIRKDSQIYFIKTYFDKGISKKTSSIVLRREEEESQIKSIESEEEFPKNVSRMFSPLIKISQKLFYKLFSNIQEDDNEITPYEKSVVRYIIGAIKKYDKEFISIKDKKNKTDKDKIFASYCDNIIDFTYINLFTEYLIKSFFYHLIQEEEKSNNIERIQEVIYLMSIYADGLQELLENLIYHTDNKVGYFYFAYNKTDYYDNDYIKKLKEKNNKINRIWEAYVVDFSSKGITDTFNKKIILSELFDPSKVIEEDTHLDLRYAAHTGLKIFQKYVVKNDGYFKVETNNLKKNNKIKYEYAYYHQHSTIDEDKILLNGTHYEVLLPISDKLVENIPNDNLISFQAKPFNYIEWLKKESNTTISCIDLDDFVKSTEKDNIDKISLIKNIGDKIITRYSSQSIIAFDYHSMGIFGTPSYLYKLLAYLQLRSSKYFKIIIIININDNIIGQIKNRIIDLFIDPKKKIWNNYTALVLILEKTAAPYIVTGETPKIITSINHSLRVYYPSKNIFNFSEEITNKFPSEFIQPYELIVKTDENNIFENYVSNILDNEIEDEKIGYKLKSKNILLGSKIITKNFYECDTLFQNSFFVDRFAFLISKQILSDDKLQHNIVLIGYGLYSEFLINTIKDFLESLQKYKIKAIVIGKNIDNDEWILRGETKDSIKSNFQKYSFITIVPIGSTLSTNDKLISKFVKYLKLSNNEISKAFEKLTNFSVILVRDECGNNITDTESDYWVSIKDKTVKTRFTFAKKVKFLVSKSGHWKRIFNSTISFPDNYAEELPILRTKTLSVNSLRAIGWPKVQRINEDTFNLELERLKSFKNYTYIHHFNWNNSHLHYYFDTEKFVNDKRKEIEEWIESIKKDKKINKSKEDNKLISLNVIITPNNNIESTFIKLINKKLFNNNAFIIYMDIYNDIRNNIIHKFSFLRKIERQESDNNGKILFKVKFHFIDHVLSTGESVRKAKSYISSIMDKDTPFETVIALINRLSFYRNKEISNYEKDEVKIYEFVKLFIPPIKTPDKECSICTSILRYKKIKKQTSIAALSEFLDKKIKKLEEINLNINEKDKYLANDRNFKRLILTHKIFYKISSLKNDYQKIINYLTELGKNNDITFKINFVKVLSTQPLSSYQHIKNFIFTYQLKELDKILSKKTLDIINFNYLLVLLKHLSEFDANALIRKKLIVTIWYRYLSSYQNLKFEISSSNYLSRLNKKREELKNKKERIKNINNELNKKKKFFLSESEKKQKSDLIQKRNLFKTELKQLESEIKTLQYIEENKEKLEYNIEQFNIFFHLFINNAIQNDEAKSLWLGELLRIGNENKSFFKKNFKLSNTIENNKLFSIFDKCNYIKQLNIDNKLITRYKNFLVWLKYDNTLILRRTIKRFEDELLKNEDLKNKFYNDKILKPIDKLELKEIEKYLKEEIIEVEYYHKYIRAYISLDFPSVLQKLIYVLYSKLLFKKLNENLINKDLPEKVNDILIAFSKIMESDAAFMVLRKPSEDKRYRIVKFWNIDSSKSLHYEEFKKNFNSSEYSYTFYLLNRKENYYPIVSNEILLNKDTKVNYGEKEELEYNAINVFRIYIHGNELSKSPIGAISFLYKNNNINSNMSFETYSKELGVFLMLLKNDFDDFIKEAYNKHSITEIINNINNQEKFERIYVNSDHPYSYTTKSLDKLYEIINQNPKLIHNLIYPFITFSDSIISWLYSKVEKYKGNLKKVGNSLKEDTTFLSVFNKPYWRFVENINDNLEDWKGNLKIVGFDIEKDFDIKWDKNILRSFIILLLKNAMYTHERLSSKNITLSFSNDSKTLTVLNDFPEMSNNIGFIKKKKEFDIKKESIKNLNLEDYSCTTLTSLVAYCKFLNLEVDFGYNQDNFFVKFNLIGDDYETENSFY